MTKKILPILIIFVVCIIQCTIFASASTVTVQNQGENKYKSIRITPELYNLSNADLSDIIIKDDKDQVVPYFINSGFQEKNNQTLQYDMVIIDSYLKDNEFYFDYKLKDQLPNDVIATSVVAESSNNNFAKNVELFGSYDNINWKKIKDDILYKIDDNCKTKITFTQPEKFTYYRFKLSNNLEKISFDKVYLEYSVLQNEASYFVETIEPKFKVTQNKSNTEIKIEGVKNLKLAELTIISDSMFKRMLSTPFGDKQIYNLNFDNDSYKDTTIYFDGQVSNEEILVATIQNNDDKPININKIIIKYYADDLIFNGSNSDTFKIEIGDSKDSGAPSYDISNYKELALKQKIDPLDIGKITSEKKDSDLKWLFNGVIVVIGLLLSFIILNKIKKIQL